MNQIKFFDGPYRWLSNFWVSPLRFGPLVFPTAEHAYQAAKSLDPDVWKLISEFTSPGHAKRMGRQIKVRDDWEDIKLQVMTEITAEKYDQHPDLYEKLLATKGMELIEGNTWGDTFWGVCNGQGENHLGRILMAYRDQ
jgi:ribA/ribD-fused uncharacterized protein